MPETVTNWGRLIGYTWGEVLELGTTWETAAALPYGVHRTFRAAQNAADWMGRSAEQLNSRLERSDMYSLAEVEAAMGRADAALSGLLASLT